MRVYVDTNHMFDGADAGFWIAMFIAVWIVIGLLFLVGKGLQAKQAAKPLQKAKGKLIEVLDEGTNSLAPLRFYIFECEDGSRIRLQRLQSNPPSIVVGDVCAFTYRGETLEDVSDINA